MDKSFLAPGPWQYHLGRGANPRFHIQTHAGYQIASTPPLSIYKPETVSQELHAKAISAVPDLINALELMLQAYAPAAQASVDANGEDCLHSAVKASRAALHKTGVLPL